MREFCELVAAEKLKIRWEANAIIRREMNSELLTLMRQAGCVRLIYGIESVSQKVLNGVGKIMARGCDIEGIVRDTSQAGIQVWLNFMFGLPGETQRDAEDNIKFVVKNKEYIHTVVPTFAFCALPPLSDAFLDPVKYGIQKNPHVSFWESKDCTNTYDERMFRFERFCVSVNKAGVTNTYPFDEYHDRSRSLGFYYLYKRDYYRAIPYLRQAIEKEPDNIELHKALKTSESAMKESMIALRSLRVRGESPN